MSFTPSEWVLRARCLRLDPEQFSTRPKDFRAWNTLSSEHYRGRLKERGMFCEECPVAAQCADDALDHRDHSVIRGGIPIPSPSRGMERKQREQLMAALHAVSEGVRPFEAIDSIIGSDKQ